MQGIEAKDLLRGLLQECPACAAYYYDNVAVITAEGELTEEQAEAILIDLFERHEAH
jgi:hypothetical protein